jgi:hypothetical protein
MIIDDNRDTIFVNEVQPKPTSLGHDYGRSSPNRNTGNSGIPQYAAFPLRACRYVVMVTTAAPLIFMRRLGLQSMTRTLSYTAKYNSSPIVTGLYKYSTQYLTNPTLVNILSPWIYLARTSMYTRLKSPLPLYQEMPEETLLSLQFPTPWLQLQLCTLLFYQHNLCQEKLDNSPANQQLNQTPCSRRLHPWFWEPHNHH